MPDEGAFMASMDAGGHQGLRPDQKKFAIYYHETEQVSSWDNYHYEVSKNGVTETWRDFFDLDAPAKETIKHYSFKEYAVNGTNYNIKQYLEAEGLTTDQLSQTTSIVSNSTDLMEAEQLLKNIYEKTIYNLTRKVPPDSYWNELRKCYGETSRFYHNFNHIAHVYTTLLPYKNEIDDWEIIVLAILYHDIVYHVNSKDNEEQSANKVKKVLKTRKVNNYRVNRCINHILATKHHQPSKDNDTNLLMDADLSILGSEPKTYQEYADAIRQEYTMYSDKDFFLGRKVALENFLQRDSVFKTAYFKKLEKPARENISAEILSLTQKLSSLPVS